jgi:putative membrane protein
MWAHMSWNGMMGGWGGLLALVWLALSIAVLIIVLLGAVWLARSLGANRGPAGGGTPAPSGPPSARDVLDVRYARGEISREEYLQARKDLDGAPG